MMELILLWQFVVFFFIRYPQFSSSAIAMYSGVVWVLAGFWSGYFLTVYHQNEEREKMHNTYRTELSLKHLRNKKFNSYNRMKKGSYIHEIKYFCMCNLWDAFVWVQNNWFKSMTSQVRKRRWQRSVCH